MQSLLNLQFPDIIIGNGVSIKRNNKVINKLAFVLLSFAFRNIEAHVLE